MDTLVDYILKVAARPDIAGCYNLTNNEPVVIADFLADVFSRLGLPAPTRRVPLRTAMAVAGVAEAAHRLLRLSGEPSITRFGVGVLAWSKTFDVSKALHDLGPPSVSLTEGVDRFIQSQQPSA